MPRGLGRVQGIREGGGGATSGQLPFHCASEPLLLLRSNLHRQLPARACLLCEVQRAGKLAQREAAVPVEVREVPHALQELVPQPRPLELHPAVLRLHEAVGAARLLERPRQPASLLVRQRTEEPVGTAASPQRAPIIRRASAAQAEGIASEAAGGAGAEGAGAEGLVRKVVAGGEGARAPEPVRRSSGLEAHHRAGPPPLPWQGRPRPGEA
mmetsp:Transcript_72788/g.213309  ORF Transcript_72788/g.213309 Transcript_72788/m.213309 type:complete len:212 (+) Transcript_72788:1001-1636(+)